LKVRKKEKEISIYIILLEKAIQKPQTGFSRGREYY